jgi:hypothetical protein
MREYSPDANSSNSKWAEWIRVKRPFCLLCGEHVVGEVVIVPNEVFA